MASGWNLWVWLQCKNRHFGFLFLFLFFFLILILILILKIVIHTSVQYGCAEVWMTILESGWNIWV